MSTATITMQGRNLTPPLASSTSSSSTTSSTSSSTNRFRANPTPVPASHEALFYQHLTKIGSIAKVHKLWRDKSVSCHLHQWIVGTQRAYKNTPLSGAALQADILTRLEALSRLLVDSLYQASVNHAMMDRSHIWDRADLQEYQRLAKAFGRGEYYLQQEGQLESEGTFLSPIDKRPMQPQNHLFMNAMMAWLRSVPMHLLDPAFAPPEEPGQASQTSFQEDQAVTLHVEAELVFMDRIKYINILRVGNFAHERIHQTGRTVYTHEMEAAFQQAMDRLSAENEELTEHFRLEQIALEQATREQIATLQQTFETETGHLRTQMHELKESNEVNRQAVNRLTATVNSQASEISQLRSANAERCVEIQHVYHKSKSSFCSLM